MISPHMSPPRLRTAPLFAFAMAFGAAASTLSAQSAGVSLVPSAERVEWDSDLPFITDWLYGGRVALQFGRFVELQPFYFYRNNVGMDSSKLAARFGADAVGRTLDLQHYGTSVQFNLGDGGVVPFVRAGAGVLRLEPAERERQDRITVSAGGGVRFGIAGLNAELFAEQLSFRMNPQNLFGPDTSAGTALPTLRNFVYGAAVTLPLSSPRDLEAESDGLRGTTAPLEPFVGRLQYASAHNLPDQEIAGVRAGIDFSPVFGVRGFYWRGINDDRDGPAEVSGYGGEAQFNLNTGPGISPYLIAGAGQVDYTRDFRDSLGSPRTDKTAFIIGGGASVRLTDRVRLNGAIRDYIMTVDESFENVASTGDLTHNTMLTAGLTISFGGRGEERAARAPSVRQTRRAPMRSAARDTVRDTIRVVEEVEVEVDSTIVTDRAPVGRDSGRFITVPVPTQGEIILRYGLPLRDRADVPVRRDSGEIVVRRDSVITTAAGTELLARLAEIERRLTARLEARREASLEAIERRQGAAAVPAPTVTMVAPSGEALADERAETPVFQRFTQVRPRDLLPYAGIGVGDGDAQLVIGVRADLGPVNPGSGLHFVPELAVGVGSGPSSVLAMANARYRFGSVGGEGSVRPYVTLGGGIYSPTVLGINTAIGSSFRIPRDAARPLFLHVELQGINITGQTRLLFGLTRSP